MDVLPDDAEEESAWFLDGRLEYSMKEESLLSPAKRSTASAAYMKLARTGCWQKLATRAAFESSTAGGHLKRNSPGASLSLVAASSASGSASAAAAAAAAAVAVAVAVAEAFVASVLAVSLPAPQVNEKDRLESVRIEGGRLWGPIVLEVSEGVPEEIAAFAVGVAVIVSVDDAADKPEGEGQLDPGLTHPEPPETESSESEMYRISSSGRPMLKVSVGPTDLPGRNKRGWSTLFSILCFS